MDADFQRDRETLRRLLTGVEYVMLTSRALDGALDSRPLQILQVDADGALWFFTNLASCKIEEIRREPQVNLAYVDAARKTFISVTGVAEILRDEHKLDELWTPAQTIFFPRGRDDLSLALLKVVPVFARYWDGNESTLGLLLKFGKAVLRGEASDLGASGRLDLQRK